MRASMGLRSRATRGRKPMCAMTSRSGVEPGRDLDQLEAFVTDAEHGALGDEQRHAARARVPCSRCSRSAPASARTSGGGPSLRMTVRPCSQATSRSPAVSVPPKTTHLRVLADVDESADADDPVAETADVDVALRVDLGEREKREVQAAAVVEVELRRLLDHRREVLSAARIAAGDRRAADQPLLVGQEHGVEQAFLGRDRRQAGRRRRRRGCRWRRERAPSRHGARSPCAARTAAA